MRGTPVALMAGSALSGKPSEDSRRLLLDAVGRAKARSPELRLSIGPSGNGYVSCLALACQRSRALAGWMARERIRERSMDRRCQATFLIECLSGSVVEPLAELLLIDGVVPPLLLETTSIRVTRFRWQHSGRSGYALRAALRLDLRRRTSRRDAWPTAAATPDMRRNALRTGIVGLFTPIVASLQASSRMSRGALWRLVADMTAYAFLNVGRRLGQEARARDEALLLLKVAGCPLNNPQTGYVAIMPPELGRTDKPAEAHWFIERGGCCRYYTLPEGEYCSTCVLRPAHEREALLREHAAEQLAQSP